MPTPQHDEHDDDTLDGDHEPDYEAMSEPDDRPCDCGQCMGSEVIW